MVTSSADKVIQNTCFRELYAFTALLAVLFFILLGERGWEWGLIYVEL